MSHSFSEFPSTQPSPFASSMGLSAPPPKRGSGWKWVLILGLVFGGGLMLVCCGGLLAFSKWGLDLVTEEIACQLRDNPVLVDKVGEVESFQMEYVSSVSTEDEDEWIYRVRGRKGEGTITVRHVTNDEGNEEILSARLRMGDGTEYDLLPVDEVEKVTPPVPE